MSRKNSQSEMEADQIVDRMHSLRKSGYKQVVTLRGDAKRLVDWKEYVGAKPILSVAAASLLGFGVARKLGLMFSRTPRTTPSYRQASVNSSSIGSTIGSSIATLATTIATNAVRSYVTNLMSGTAKGDVHDRFQHDTSKP